MHKIIAFALAVFLFAACTEKKTEAVPETEVRLTPVYTTDTVSYDSDDPAIWINKADITKSLILGTDKDSDGGVFVFDLTGKEDTSKRVPGIKRPNNIDITYDMSHADSLVDIAVFSERELEQIRIFAVPAMVAIDGGGMRVFEDSEYRAVMGVALYKSKLDSSIHAIVSRKADSLWIDNYLYQYRLISSNGKVEGQLIRKFGKFSGAGEIEAIAVDQELGFIYYSDEGYGIRKYHAEPSMGNEELAAFGLSDFKEDREGISIYKTSETTGYLLVSNQQANEFLVYPREGSNENNHSHQLIARIPFSTNESDGSEVSQFNFGAPFEQGIFVAMSDNKTFQIYTWESILKEIIRQQSLAIEE